MSVIKQYPESIYKEGDILEVIPVDGCPQIDYDSRTDSFSVLYGLGTVDILAWGIEYQDLEQEHFIGWVEIRDNIENGIRAIDRWISYTRWLNPGNERIIEPFEKNILTGERDFTLQLDVNEAMEKYLLSRLEEYILKAKTEHNSSED